jgi:hypothetical protein
MLILVRFTGLCHASYRDSVTKVDIFSRSLHFNQYLPVLTFCVYADSFLGLSKAFHCFTIIIFSFASLEISYYR